MQGSVFVTGASGFIGRHLAARLQREGFALAPFRRVELSEGRDWGDALNGVEVVVHLAALAHERATAAERRGDYDALKRVNAVGTEALARASASAGVRHFIFLSTIGVCGERTTGRPFDDDSPPAPCSMYARSKWEAEQRLAEVATQCNLGITVLRPTLVYGPGNGGNLARLLRAIARGWPLPFAAVRNKRNLTGVHNLTALISRLARGEATNRSFVVSDVEALSTADIARHLAAGLQREARLVPIPPGVLALAARMPRAQSLQRLLASLEVDCRNLVTVTGWRPPVAAKRGLYETGAWFARR